MQYRVLNANDLCVSETRAYCQTETFERLFSKMASDRFVVRYIVAPKGFGKLTLCLAYARYIRAENVVVVDGEQSDLLDASASMNFLHELDLRANVLLIIDEIPYLDETAVHSLSNLIDGLLEDGVETIVTARPSCDVLGGLQCDKVRIDAQELLVSAESLQKLRGGTEKAKRSNLDCDYGKVHMPYTWGMAWKGYEAGVDDLLDDIREEDLTIDIKQAMTSMLVLRRGKTASLALPHGSMPPKDLAWIGTSYPFLGLSIGSDAFQTIRCTNAQIVKLVGAQLRTCSRSIAKSWISGLVDNIFEFGRLDALEALCDEDIVKPDVVLKAFESKPWRVLDQSKMSFLEKLAQWSVAENRQDASLILAIGMEVLGCATPTSGSGDFITMLRKSEAMEADAKGDASKAFVTCLGRTWISSQLVIGRASSGAVDGRESWLARDSESYESARRLEKRRSARFAWAALKALELSCSRNDIGAYKVFYPVSAALWPKANSLDILDKMGLVILARALAVLTARKADGKEIAELLARVESFSGHDKRLKGDGAKGERQCSRFDEKLAELIAHVRESVSLTKRRRGKEAQQSLSPCLEVAAPLPSMATPPAWGLTNGSLPFLGGEPEYPTIYLRLFGGFRIYVDGVERESSALEKRRSRELLVVLALREGRQVPRDDLVKALWNDSSMRHGTDSLYAAWSSLRRSLDRIAGTVDAPYLMRSSTGYRINSYLIGTDVHDFKKVARYLLRNVDAAIPQSQKNGAPQTDALLKLFDFADELYNGRVFGGALVDRGSIEIAEQLKEIMCEVMLAGASFAASLGLEQRASWFASRAIETGGMREEFYQARMKAQIALGQRSGALDTFFRMQRFLQEQQGVDPSAESARLYNQVLFDDAGDELNISQPMLDVTAIGADGSKVGNGGEGCQGKKAHDELGADVQDSEDAPDDDVQSPGAVDAAS